MISSGNYYDAFLPGVSMAFARTDMLLEAAVAGLADRGFKNESELLARCGKFTDDHCVLHFQASGLPASLRETLLDAVRTGLRQNGFREDAKRLR